MISTSSTAPPSSKVASPASITSSFIPSECNIHFHAQPITWGGDIRPHSLVGHRDSKNQSLTIDVAIQEAGSGGVLGVHMQGER